MLLVECIVHSLLSRLAWRPQCMRLTAADGRRRRSAARCSSSATRSRRLPRQRGWRRQCSAAAWRWRTALRCALRTLSRWAPRCCASFGPPATRRALSCPESSCHPYQHTPKMWHARHGATLLCTATQQHDLAQPGAGTHATEHASSRPWCRCTISWRKLWLHIWAAKPRPAACSGPGAQPHFAARALTRL